MSHQQYLTTKAAARHLGTNSEALLRAIRRGKVPEPQRDPHGYFAWTPEAIEAARVALATDLRTAAGRATYQTKVMSPTQ